MPRPALMLATPAASTPEATIDQLMTAGGWSWEFKYDGIRALVQVSGGFVTITNRRARDITYRYPDVVAHLAGLKRDVILDGEIVCPDANGRPDFHRVHRRDAQGTARAAAQLATSCPAVLVVFDILQCDEVDLRMLDYRRRRRMLEELHELPAHATVPPVSDDGPMMWTVVQEMGLEGLVAKRHDSRYTGMRSPAWVKIKRTHRLSALVSGYDPGEGSRAKTFGALQLTLVDDAGQLVPVGSVGSGFTEADVQLIWSKLSAGEHPIVVEVAYLEVSPAGQLRQPVFKGLRSDIPAQNCTMAQIGGGPNG